jgi:uncharacterized damage-inducible protein DinB
MNKSDLNLLFDYNYWANRRVCEAAARLAPGQYEAPYKLSHGSLRGALVHVLGAEIVWRMRCQEGVSLSGLLKEDELPTLEALNARWSGEEAAMHSYLASLNDYALGQPIQYKTTKGQAKSTVLWQILAHVVNHGTQFRSEAAVALTDYGQSPGDLDLIFYIREVAVQ